MSFAGHAFNAIKANRDLLKKKSFFKDAAFDPKWGEGQKDKFKRTDTA